MADIHHQPHPDPGDEGPEDSQGPQAPQDGEGYPSFAEHSDAGPTTGLAMFHQPSGILAVSGGESRPPLLPVVLHLLRPGRGDVRASQL